MANVHFFCELLESGTVKFKQVTDKQFGPVISNETTKFRVSSMHKWTGTNDPWAYAMLDGEIFYQEDLNDSTGQLLNAIIKVKATKVTYGLPIKYIVYRGIKRDSLLDSSNQYSDPAKNTSNHIIEKIFKGKTVSLSDYLELGLGIVDSTTLKANEVTIANSEDLDKLFLNDYAYTTPQPVEPGLKLGKFKKDSFGIDIILEGFWQKPTLKDIRKVKDSIEGNIIDVSTLSSNVDLKRATQEKILHYLDVTAFIGLVANYEIGFDDSNDAKGIEIYDKIQEQFTNKNKIYFDIRNSNNLSLDFYNSTASNLKLYDFTAGSDIPIVYGTNGWPILIAEEEYANTANSNKFAEVKITLPILTNHLNYFYLYTGEIKKRKEKFYPLVKNSGVLEPTILNLIKFKDSSNIFFKSAYYFRILFLKDRDTSETPAGTKGEIKTVNFLDNLFNFGSLENMLVNFDPLLTSSYPQFYQKFVSLDQNKTGENDSQFNSILSSYACLDNEGKRVVFYALPFANNNNPITQNNLVPQSLINSNVSSVPTNLGKQQSKSQLSKINIKIDPTTEKKALKYFKKTKKGEVIEDFDFVSYAEFDPEGLFMICLDITEFNSLKALLTNFDQNLHPVYLQIHDIRSGESEDEKYFYEVELRLAGYNSTGQVTYATVTGGNSILYSIDAQVFSSDKASKREGGLSIDKWEFIIEEPLGSDRYEAIVRPLRLIKGAGTIKSSSNPTSISFDLEHLKNYAAGLISTPAYQQGYIKQAFDIKIKFGNLGSVSGASNADHIVINGASPYDSIALTWPLVNDYYNFYVSEHPAFNPNDSKNTANLLTTSKHYKIIPTDKNLWNKDTNQLISAQEAYNLGYFQMEPTTTEILLDLSDLYSEIGFDQLLYYMKKNNANNFVVNQFTSIENKTKLREWVIATVIAHEGMHLIQALENPIYHVWRKLENYFDTQSNINNYQFYDQVVSNNQHKPLYKQTGGHLFGNPTGKAACVTGTVVGKKILADYKRKIENMNPPQGALIYKAYDYRKLDSSGKRGFPYSCADFQYIF